jgi:TM2 domain-containing membrane protein YozV/cold shock CspA family protein
MTVKGQVLNYDTLRGEGLISAENGERYTFAGVEWKSAPQQLRTGTSVDFSVEGGAASAIYVVGNPGAGPRAIGGHAGPGAAYGQQEKSNVVAALLAFFLGGFGAHKFYLGYNTEGVILLATTVVSWILLIVIIGFFGLMAVGIICLIEAIIYLTKSPADFHATYVEGRRPWF